MNSSGEGMLMEKTDFSGGGGSKDLSEDVTFAQRPLRCFTPKSYLSYILFPGSHGLGSLEADAESDFGVHAID